MGKGRESRQIAVSIDASADAVYAYPSDLARLERLLESRGTQQPR